MGKKLEVILGHSDDGEKNAARRMRREECSNNLQAIFTFEVSFLQRLMGLT